MPSGNVIRTHLFGFLPKCAELDFPIAEHVRIWRTSGFVFADHSIHHTLFILFFKIKKQKRYIKSDSALHSISTFFPPTAWQEVRLPDFDKDSRDIIARLLQKRRGDGAIHSPRQTHKDPSGDTCRCLFCVHRSSWHNAFFQYCLSRNIDMEKWSD